MKIDRNFIRSRLYHPSMARFPGFPVQYIQENQRPCDVTTSDPVIFPDGSYGFTVQSAAEVFYPGAGIYRLSSEGALSRLVDIPPHNRQCSDPGKPEDALMYGTVSWSTDRGSYIYTGSDERLGPGSPCRGAVVIYGRSDGSAAWDLTGLLQGAREVHWAGVVNAGN